MTKAKTQEAKVKTQTQVQRSGFRDSARFVRNHDGTWLRQIGAEMVKTQKRQLEEVLYAAR